ncbi:MAG: AAA family ATPase [Bacteroidales bacterium]|nr:AAA family ATPase [Bacteroidales bacterium]
MIGRKEEYRALRELFESPESQFVAVYGRRRVGKTYLIREAFDYRFDFQHTGIYGASRSEQLQEFRESLISAGLEKCPVPKTWNEAFHILSRFIESKPKDGNKKVIFIDELPWMDTTRSNFVRALDHFWNGWATTRKDIILIICGSATSWIINNVIMNYGGLHNRLTKQIFLEPFNLKECKAYCEANDLGYSMAQILEAYMALGGIPYYWSFMKRGNSVAQNFDNIFFSERGALSHEFDALYKSLFKKPKKHIAIIHALATKKKGLERGEILKATKLSDNEAFSTALKELEQCGFIRKYTALGKKTKEAVYQLMDNYTLFYFDFISQNENGNPNFWTSNIASSLHSGWAGRAFERVCLQHVPQIKRALGFSAVICNAHSWQCHADGNHGGSQIDLVLDRNDDTINLCEIKYCNGEYLITKDEDLKIKNRKNALIAETGTKKGVLITMITTYGLVKNPYAHDIHCQVTMEDLFQ